MIASGAMDCEVRLHQYPYRPGTDTQCFEVHAGRVKDIAVCPGEPSLFWSASEDGTIRQWDTRLPSCGADLLPNHTASDAFDSANCLVNLGDASPGHRAILASGVAARAVRAMACAINPRMPYQLAVAAGDEAVRIYDRRKTSPGRPRREVVTPWMLAVRPPHATHTEASLHATSVQFSHDGNKLLAYYHNDHAYLFSAQTGAASSVAGRPYLEESRRRCAGRLPPPPPGGRRARRRTATRGGGRRFSPGGAGPGALPLSGPAAATLFRSGRGPSAGGEPLAPGPLGPRWGGRLGRRGWWGRFRRRRGGGGRARAGGGGPPRAEARSAWVGFGRKD
ncbi:unnamed protein product [Heterosigma akashiwo]